MPLICEGFGKSFKKTKIIRKKFNLYYRDKRIANILCFLKKIDMMLKYLLAESKGSHYFVNCGWSSKLLLNCPKNSKIALFMRY